MSKNRCSQCDKELPPSWATGANTNWDAVCPECASRDLKKKSLRRRRVLDTSVRKKANQEMMPQPAAPGQPSTQVPAEAQAQAAAQSPAPAQPQAPAPVPSNVSQRAPYPTDIELDTDDPLLLAAQQAAAEEDTKEVDPLQETAQIPKPKPKPKQRPPPGPQVRLNF